MPTARPLRVARIAVDEQSIYACDDAFPVVAQIDRTTGEVQRLVWWELSAAHRRRSASNALLIVGDDLWVSSPAAGGMVRINTATGQVSQIALDEAPGPIVATDHAIWIAAEANWANYDDGATQGRDDAAHPRRRVVVTEPVIPPPTGWNLSRWRTVREVEGGAAASLDDGQLDQDDRRRVRRARELGVREGRRRAPRARRWNRRPQARGCDVQTRLHHQQHRGRRPLSARLRAWEENDAL